MPNIIRKTDNHGESALTPALIKLADKIPSQKAPEEYNRTLNAYSRIELLKPVIITLIRLVSKALAIGLVAYLHMPLFMLLII